MAKRKRGTSSHTTYRHARALLAILESEQAKLERSRPRTSGKKAARSRALNSLARKIRAVRGQLTKARNAIARAARTNGAAKKLAKQKRSEAARKGWVTRRSRKPAASRPPSGGLFMPHLTPMGVVWINPVGSDRSAEGHWWHNAGRVLANQPSSIHRFSGQSVHDTETGRSLPFVTDSAVIAEFEHEFDFGPSFYKRRDEVPRFATE